MSNSEDQKLGILLAVRLIPDGLMRELREEALRHEGHLKSCFGLAAIVIIWNAGAAWLI